MTMLMKIYREVELVQRDMQLEVGTEAQGRELPRPTDESALGGL